MHTVMMPDENHRHDAKDPSPGRGLHGCHPACIIFFIFEVVARTPGPRPKSNTYTYPEFMKVE